MDPDFERVYQIGVGRETHLQALKLPTFLREYDKLARQCAAEGVDHARYLLRLNELEIIDRERRTVERRIKEAKFPPAAVADGRRLDVYQRISESCR